MNSGLDSLTLDNEFTPSTPYVHKFRTELCKNFQLYGKCKWGDEVSIKTLNLFVAYETVLTEPAKLTFVHLLGEYLNFNLGELVHNRNILDLTILQRLSNDYSKLIHRIRNSRI